MKKLIDLKSFLCGALLAIAIVFSVAAANEGSTAWEYKVVTGTVYLKEGKLEDEINRYVAQGWQFVTASGAGDRGGGFAVIRREKQ